MVRQFFDTTPQGESSGRYRDNYDRIFGNKESPMTDTKDAVARLRGQFAEDSFYSEFMQRDVNAVLDRLKEAEVELLTAQLRIAELEPSPIDNLRKLSTEMARVTKESGSIFKDPSSAGGDK